MLMKLISWLQLVLYGFSHQVILAKEPQSLAWYVMDVAWGSGTPHQPISTQASPQDQTTGTSFSSVSSSQVTRRSHNASASHSERECLDETLHDSFSLHL